MLYYFPLEDNFMNFSIYFCADGILRAKFAENKPMLPLKFIQETSPFKTNDFRFLTKWWDYNTFFEKGLTISSFLNCLEPWADFWTDLTGKDVTKYISEVRMPHIVKSSNETTEKDNYDVDWIQLSHNIDAEIASEFQKSEEDNDLLETDINAWFNADKKMRLTGKWNIYNSFSLSGFIIGKEEQYSVEYTPINKMANVPFILNHNLALSFSEHQLRLYSGDKTDSIIKENAFGVTTLAHNHHLVGYTDFKLREVVEGFFHWMFTNPKSAEAFVEQLNEDKLEFDAQIAEMERLEELSKNTIEESNVISLFKKDSPIEIDNSTDIVDSENNKLEIKVSSNAFSSIIDHWEKDSEFWEGMVKKALSEDVITRIGNTLLQEPLETRLFSFVLDDKNEQHIPKPTDFKDI